MKRILLLLVIINLIGCTNVNNKSSDVELVETPGSIEELLELSPIVVEAKILEAPKKFKYKDENYYLSKIEVVDLFRDNDNLLEQDDEILLFQNNLGDIDPLVKKNDKLLLFLNKIEIPEYENVYRIIGLYKGKFKVEVQKDIKIYRNDNLDNEKETVINALDLKEKVKNIKYNEQENKIIKDKEEEHLKELEKIN